MRIPIGWRLAIEKGRLLVLSRFPAAARRMTAALAEQRNQMVAALSHEVYFAHITPSGRTSRLSKPIAKWNIILKTPAKEPLRIPYSLAEAVIRQVNNTFFF
jgi:hypothetical protein